MWQANYFTGLSVYLAATRTKDVLKPLPTNEQTTLRVVLSVFSLGACALQITILFIRDTCTK